MPNFQQLVVHEEHRWSYMTEDQLLRRLRKITQPQKLQCFIIMASRRGNAFLDRAARDRADVLGIDLGRVLDADWGFVDADERALRRNPEYMAERRRQSQGRAASSSITSLSVPTSSQRSTRGNPVSISSPPNYVAHPTRFSVDAVVGSFSTPKSKKKPKKKAVRHIRFGKGGS